MKKITILLFIVLLTLPGCSKGWFKPADVKDTPVNVYDRVVKNIESGRGVRFGKDKQRGGVFDFASSNELWRASIDVLDFVPFTNASYSGGILITEWFNGNSSSENVNRDLKITVRFLSNEIRADALDVSIHEKKCQNNYTNCNVNKISSKLESEIKLAILKRAAYLEKTQLKGIVDEYRKKKRNTLQGQGGTVK